MEPPYPIKPPFTYQPVQAVTYDDGVRIYETPSGPAPSVTTILSTLPKPGLDEWRARVGEEEARRITKEATDIGSDMHDQLEGFVSAYLQGKQWREPQTDKERIATAMAEMIKRFALIDIDEVWAIEEALFCHNLYAGRTDLIAKYLGKGSIIDYKTSRRDKTLDYIKSYRLQIAAYAVAHEQMFGVDVIEQGVILVALRPDQRNSGGIQRFIIPKDELQELKIEWMGIVEDFHRKLGG